MYISEWRGWDVSNNILRITYNALVRDGLGDHDLSLKAMHVKLYCRESDETSHFARITFCSCILHKNSVAYCVYLGLTVKWTSQKTICKPYYSIEIILHNYYYLFLPVILVYSSHFKDVYATFIKYLRQIQ